MLAYWNWRNSTLLALIRCSLLNHFPNFFHNALCVYQQLTMLEKSSFLSNLSLSIIVLHCIAAVDGGVLTLKSWENLPLLQHHLLLLSLVQLSWVLDLHRHHHHPIDICGFHNQFCQWDFTLPPARAVFCRCAPPQRAMSRRRHYVPLPFHEKIISSSRTVSKFSYSCMLLCYVYSIELQIYRDIM